MTHPDNRPVADLCVIIPVKDRRKLLMRALDSVAAQSVLPRQLIVVDNGSSDGSQQAAREWAARHSALPVEFLFLEERRPGAPAARNAGLAEARAEWVSFFDSDDTMRPGFVAAIAAAATASPRADIIYWKAVLHACDETVRELRFSRHRLMFNHIHHAILATQRFAASRTLLLRAGGWRDLPIWNDWELGLRLLPASSRAVALPEVLVDIYAQRQSITGTDFSSRAAALRATIECALAEMPAGSRQRRNVLFRYAVVAGHLAAEGSAATADAMMAHALADRDARGRTRLAMRLAFRWTARGRRGAPDLFATWI